VPEVQCALPDNVQFHDLQPDTSTCRQELLAGLRRRPRSIDPKFFYDARGPALFERITRLPEYYPTRTEIGILTDHAPEIAAYCGRGCVFIEPGSGSSEKVRLLLEALQPSAYVPLDISADQLFHTALALGREFPWLGVRAFCTDFVRGWHPDG
jgi:uncharacterized SAM-dependent methyltransferase